MKRARNEGFTLIELMIVIAIIAIIAAIAIPNLLEARKSGNETSAIGSLKAILSAQTFFSQGDKDKDGNTNFASNLTALGSSGYGSLIDGTLVTGTKGGYNFATSAGAPSAPEACSLWCASASPITPGMTGDRYFFINQAGQTFYSTAGPATLVTTNATPPSGYIVIGK